MAEAHHPRPARADRLTDARQPLGVYWGARWGHSLGYVHVSLEFFDALEQEREPGRGSQGGHHLLRALVVLEAEVRLQLFESRRQNLVERGADGACLANVAVSALRLTKEINQEETTDAMSANWRLEPHLRPIPRPSDF